MRAALLASLLAVSAPPAAAGVCPSPDMVREAGGAVFTHADGTQTEIVYRSGNERLAMHDYRPHGSRGFWRAGPWGIYETTGFKVSAGVDGVGTIRQSDLWTFSETPPAPKPGLEWSGSVVQKREIDTDAATQIRKERSKLSVRFKVLAPIKGKIGGCTYDLWPVEAVFTGKSQVSRRWLYFPDFDFAVMTRERDHFAGTTYESGLKAIALPKD
ncbi:MAG: hypothetical protein HZT43_06830 [Exiguobacterium profundum]|nr:MAG: hypothetical protein HZT43_06830 [Exiguobacterium profundum]